MTTLGGPFDEGQLAAARGEPASSNPYPEEDDDHALWAEGYDYVGGSDEDGEPREDV
jgi:hypothetical protein